MLKRVIIFISLLMGLTALHAETLKKYGYSVVKSYPHATTSYTQGLQIVDGELFEGTGMYGESRLMRVDIESGKELQRLATLPKEHFGEGITILGDTIYMLTWREGVLHRYHKTTGKKIDQKLYSGEGWGLTSDGDKLYMSDGSSRITIRDRVTFQPLASHSVTLNGRPIQMLNELEWIDGKIWANVYYTDQIVIINPKSFEVEGVIDLTGILLNSHRSAKTDVLNGIAYDEKTKKIYITGKYWSRLFEIEIYEE